MRKQFPATVFDVTLMGTYASLGIFRQPGKKERDAEAKFGIGTVFGANMAGYLGNNFLPARAGELLRSVLISRRSSLSKTYVLTTALGELNALGVSLLDVGHWRDPQPEGG